MELLIPELDERLAMAAQFFPACDTGADIGADHGRLSCFLLDSGKARRMIVSDISAESLGKARKLLSLHNLEDKAEFVVADGLNAIRNPVEAIAILGMGGATAARILSNDPVALHNAVLILSAHTDLPLLRKTLEQIDYHLTQEKVVCARHRYYIILKAERGEELLSPQQIFLGPRLMEATTGIDQTYLKYLEKRMGAYSCMRAPEAEDYRRWLGEEWKRAHDTICI